MDLRDICCEFDRSVQTGDTGRMKHSFRLVFRPAYSDAKRRGGGLTQKRASRPNQLCTVWFQDPARQRGPRFTESGARPPHQVVTYLFSGITYRLHHIL